MESLTVLIPAENPVLLDDELYNAALISVEAVVAILKERNSKKENEDTMKDYYVALDDLCDKCKDNNSLLDIVKESLTKKHPYEAYGSLFTLAAKYCYSDLAYILRKLKELNKIYLKEWLTRTDKDGNTAFNYAVEEGQTLDHNLVQALIIDGECINWNLLNVEDHEGVIVLDRIPSAIIEDVLNECVTESNDRKMENYEMKMNLSLFSHKENESLFIEALNSSSSHQHLLSHPLILTFLHCKWQKVKYVWYLNEAFNVCFYILIMGFILFKFLENSAASENQTVKTLITIFGSQTMTIFITIMASVLMLREIMQLKMFKQHYFISFDNILELTILVLTMMLFFSDNDLSKESLSAWLIVLITLELFLLIEKLHLPISLYISMFRKVTFNFVKLTSMLFCLVIAFGVSFHYLLHLKSYGKPQCANNGEVDQTKFSNNVMDSILKTAIMSTGEFDFSNLNFQYFPASRLLFAVFIFSIFLVAMNLLNGIAISDIQDIRKVGNEYLIWDQIECIMNIENWRLLFSSIFRTNAWKPGMIFKTCFSDNIITYYPNRRFPSNLVTCTGHKQWWYTHKIVFNFVKIIHLFSLKCFGEVKNLCKQCRSQYMEKDHQCFYKHHYIILPAILAKAKEIKDNEQKLGQGIQMQKLIETWEKYSKQMINKDEFVNEIGMCMNGKV